MTLREMRRAIKAGHPTCVLRMLKYWTPMFYAGRSYNYANECMELLHNIIHDWPADTAQVLLAGMLVNTTGRVNGFKEGDLDVEHLNNSIKSRAHGANATPELLTKVTPAIGVLRNLAEDIFMDLDVTAAVQHHTKVKQDQDVKILVSHLLRSKIFNFGEDRSSEHRIVDLYRTGVRRLAGPSGGHAKHLARHKLRLRSRHNVDEDAGTLELSEAELELALDNIEMTEGHDGGIQDYIVDEEDEQ